MLSSGEIEVFIRRVMKGTRQKDLSDCPEYPQDPEFLQGDSHLGWPVRITGAVYLHHGKLGLARPSQPTVSVY